MKRIFLALLCVTILAGLASAQDFRRYELFGGYSLLNQGLDPSLEPVGLSRLNAHGFDTSFTVNPTSNVGVVADFTAGFSTVSTQGVNIGNLNTYSYLFGPRFTPVRGKVVTPWVQFLVGGIRGSFSDNQNLGIDGSDNAFAMRAGGGVDLKLARNVYSRTDLGWEHTRFDFGSDNQGQNHFHFSTGIALAFGK